MSDADRPSRWRWTGRLWLLTVLLGGSAGLFHVTARHLSRPVERLLDGALTLEAPLSEPIVVSAAPMIVAIEMAQILRPASEPTTSQVTLMLVREHDTPTATAPVFELLLELEHEFVRGPDGADMEVTTHATLADPGTYHLRLERLKMAYPEAGTALQVRVDRLAGSAVAHSAGAVVLTGLTLITAIVATVLWAVQFVRRVREEEATRHPKPGVGS